MDQNNQERVSVLLQNLLTAADPLSRRQTIIEIGRCAGRDEPTILALLNYLQIPDLDEVTRWEILRVLGKIAHQHPQAIAALLQILEQGRPPSQRIAAEELTKIAIGDAGAIQTLAALTGSSTNPVTQRWAIEALGGIGADTPIARDALIELIYHATDESVRTAATKSLAQVDRGSDPAITAWMHFLRYETNYYIRQPIIDILKKVAIDHPGAIAELQDMLNVTDTDKVGEYTRKLAQMGLSVLNLNPDNRVDNVDLFLQALRKAQTPKEKNRFAYSLLENGRLRVDEIVATFLEILEDPNDTATAESLADTMGQSYAAFIVQQQAIDFQELRRTIIGGISRWAKYLSASTRTQVIEVVSRQLEQTQDTREKAQLTGLLGQVGGATAAHLESLTSILTGNQSIQTPPHIQLMAELRNEVVPPELLDQTLNAQPTKGFGLEQKLAVYQLSKFQGEGEMDGIKLLLERLVVSTTDDEVMTIVTTLLLQKQRRPDVIQTLIRLGQEAEDPIRLGIYLHTISELARGSEVEEEAQAFLNHLFENHADPEIRAMAEGYLQNFGDAEPSE